MNSFFIDLFLGLFLNFCIIDGALRMNSFFIDLFLGLFYVIYNLNILAC